MEVLSIWTGAWVGRAGMLAEMLSFFILAPEILGKERLKRVEEALRRGLESATVQTGASFAWIALIAMVFVGTGIMVVLAAAASVGFSEIYAWQLLVGFTVWVVGLGANIRCRVAIKKAHLVEHETDEEELAIVPRWMARTSIIVLNPRKFARVRPAPWLWVMWFLGIPVHLFNFVAYSIIPPGILGVVHLEQRLLASGVGLRSLVVGTGIVLFFGGMGAQFLATF